MKCQICNKNEANIVFTQIIDNEKIVIEICTECARKKGVSVEIQSAVTPGKLDSFIGGWIGKEGKKEETQIWHSWQGLCATSFTEEKAINHE